MASPFQVDLRLVYAGIGVGVAAVLSISAVVMLWRWRAARLLIKAAKQVKTAPAGCGTNHSNRRRDRAHVQEVTFHDIGLQDR
eukprot:3874139-Pleurochrysis_carterae.AAC.3